MANPYDTGLDKNPANYQPLTPLVFLERAASVHPDHVAIIHGKRASPMREFYARTPPARLGACRARHRRRRHRLGDARQHARHARGALRRADDRRRAARHQHAARCAGHRLHARPRRDQGADRRYASSPRVLKEALTHGQGEAAGHRLRRPRMRRRGRAARHARLRGVRRRAATRISPGRCRPTNGTPSRSTTPPAPPAIRRAWSITIAARR